MNKFPQGQDSEKVWCDKDGANENNCH